MSLRSSEAGSCVRIRTENSDSAAEGGAIRVVNESAFGGLEEADLVDHLRASGDALLSLVAELDSDIIGHIMFSRMWISNADGRTDAVALAPLAVAPAHQRKGMGSLLVWRGLELLEGSGERIVVVVGHPDYYPRFGFSTHRARSLDSPFPREAFMALELCPGALDGVQGVVMYPQAFGI